MKKLFSLVLSLVLFVAVLPLTASAEEGTLGEAITYSLTDGALTVRGTGAMSDFDTTDNRSPFYQNAEITKIDIEDGITSLGANVFYGCSALASAELPDSISAIGDAAFYGCNALEGVVIGNGLVTVGEDVLKNCPALIGAVLFSDKAENPENLIASLPGNAVFVAYTSTGAEAVCESYGIQFEALDGKECNYNRHSFRETARTAPGCTQPGSITYTCSVCGGTYEEWLAPSDHTVTYVEAVQATCTKDGHTAYSYCTVCNAVLSERQALPALGHNWSGGTVTKAPTYTAAGVRTYRCYTCGAERTEALPRLPKLSNPLTVKAKAVKVSYKKLKKKTQSVSRKKVLAVSGAQGTVTYTKKSGNKKITVNKKTGKITVKKGLKKGTYKVKIAVKAAGTDAYNAKTRTVTVKITVK